MPGDVPRQPTVAHYLWDTRNEIQVPQSVCVIPASRCCGNDIPTTDRGLFRIRVKLSHQREPASPASVHLSSQFARSERNNLYPMRPKSSGVPVDLRLLVLALGMFALGTDNFVIAGLLPEIARGFHVGIGAAGQMSERAAAI